MVKPKQKGVEKGAWQSEENFPPRYESRRAGSDINTL